MLPGRAQPGKAGKFHMENLIKVEPVRFENGEPMLIAGISERYNGETSKAIPAICGLDIDVPDIRVWSPSLVSDGPAGMFLDLTDSMPCS